MSFRSCFVARLTDKQPRSVEIIARHDASGKRGQELPSTQNLGTFCFPLGPEHVTAKEYMAPEVTLLPLYLLLYFCLSHGA